MAVEPLPVAPPTQPPAEKLKVAWIVEETVRFYRQHAISLITIFLMANVIMWGVQYYSGAQAERMFERHDISIEDILDNPEEAYSEIIPLLVDLALLAFLMLAALFLVALLFQGMAIRFVYDHLSGGHTTWPEALVQVLPRYPVLIAATIIAGLVIVLGLVALVVPGIVLAMMFVLVPHAAILEGNGPITSLSRSNNLTRGNKWTILFFLAFWFVVLLMFSMLIRQVAPGVWQDAVQLIEGTLFGPVIPIATTVIYHRVSSGLDS